MLEHMMVSLIAHLKMKLDFSRTFLLNLDRIGRRTFEILVYLPISNMLLFETIEDLKSL